MKSAKQKNSGIFEFYHETGKKKKCKECGKEFIQKYSAKFERKYCPECSKKRKADYESLWKVKAEECED